MQLRKDSLGEIDEGKPKGLPNLGSTCYVNASLQSLFLDEILRSKILRWVPSQDNFNDPWSCFLEQIKILFTYLESSRRLRFPMCYVLDTLQLSHRLSEDPCEFTVKFIEIVEVLFEESRIRELKDFVKTHMNLTWTQSRRCTTCGDTAQTDQHNYGIRLPIPSNIKTFQQCWDAHFGTEKITDFSCPKCMQNGQNEDDKREQIVEKKILAVPDVLHVRFKRTQYVVFPHEFECGARNANFMTLSFTHFTKKRF